MWNWLTDHFGSDDNHRSRLSSLFSPPSSSGSQIAAALAGSGDDYKYSIDRMQRLHSRLQRFESLPENDVIELLRALSEFLVYADQTPPESTTGRASSQRMNCFEYFCEANMLGLLVQLSQHQKKHQSPAVQTQLLQTVSILIQNIATPTSLYYLLSNNHVNHLLEAPFDISSDDDVRDWFVTLLKALSLRLNKETVQFFFDRQHDAFPLYVQALRLRRCPDPMVGVAVKTLVLNILRVPDDRVRQFVLQYQDGAYFHELATALNDRALELQQQLTFDIPSQLDPYKVQEKVEDYVDHCFYLQDLLDVNIPELCYLLGDLVYNRHFRGLLVGSILPNCNLPTAYRRVSTQVALYLVTRALGIFDHTPLVNALAFLLLHHEGSEHATYSAVALGSGGRSNSSSSFQDVQNRESLVVKYEKAQTFVPHSDDKCRTNERCYLEHCYDSGDWSLEDVEAFHPSSDTNCVYQALCHLMHSQHHHLSSSAVLVFLAVLDNNAIDYSLVHELRLRCASFRHTKQHELTQEDDDSRHDVEEETSSMSDVSVNSESNAHEYQKWIVQKAFKLLSKRSRLLDAQLCTRLLMESMVESRQGATWTTTCLASDDREELQALYASSSQTIYQAMIDESASSSLFITLVEEAYNAFLQSDFPCRLQLTSCSPFEYLIDDPTAFASDPFTNQAPTIRERQPINDIEQVQLSLHILLLLRKLRQELDPTFEDDLDQVVVKEEDRIGDDSLKHMEGLACRWGDHGHCSCPSNLSFVLTDEMLTVVETVVNTKDSERLQLRIDMNRISTLIDTRDRRLLHLTLWSSNPIDKWKKLRNTDMMADGIDQYTAALLFTTAQDCQIAHEHVEKKRADVCRSRYEQLVNLFRP